MTKGRREEIRKRCDAATPGPWVWDVHSHNKIVYLRTDHSGYFYVMGFQRWGMGSAAPTFQVYEKYQGPVGERGSKGMFRADKLTKSLPGKEHNVGYDDYLDHPDAEFIAHSRQDVLALLDALEEMEENLQGLRPVEGGKKISGYTVRAVAVHGNRQDVVSDDKDANMFDVHMGCGDGNREWVASFRSREEATVFCRLMERQGAVGEWRDRVMREATDGKDTG